MTFHPGPVAWTGLLLGATAEQIESTKLLYLGIAFALAWVAISAYMFWIFRRQRRLEQHLQKIRGEANAEQSKLAADNKSGR